MKKTTEINWTISKGLECRIIVKRTYGYEDERVNLDGDIITHKQWQEDATLLLTVKNAPVKIEDERVCLPTFRSALNTWGVKAGVPLTKKGVTKIQDIFIGMPEDTAKHIIALASERLTDEIDPKDEAFIARCKKAIELGHVLPETELAQRIKNARDCFFEGCYGPTPYDSWVSEEEINRLHEKYPEK